MVVYENLRIIWCVKLRAAYNFHVYNLRLKIKEFVQINLY